MSTKVEKSKKKQSKADSAAATTVASLDETYKKVMSSLLPSIEDHVTSEEYSASEDSLDFLSAKNSLLLSYLIDLVQLVRLVEKKKLAQKKKGSKDTNESDSDNDDDDSDGDDEAAEIDTSIKSCLARLNEMKVALDKIRPLEKKMRYQLDRLLAAASSATSFAAGGEESEDEENGGDDVNSSANADPLSFRPNLEMMGSDNDDNEDGDGQEDSEGDAPSDDDDNSDDDDEDLRAAKAVARAGSSKKNRRGSAGDDADGDDGKKNAIYQPPRLAAVPFAEREKAEEKAERALARQRRRMRQSELLQTLRAADGTDRPEEEDLDGGAALGKQKEAARRMAEREAEKTKFEEEMMVRLTQSRKEKKARGRMMREEQSNLGAIADLGRLAAGVADAFGGSDDGGDSDGGGGGLAGMVGGGGSSGRYENGKRRRGGDDYAEIHGDRRRRKTGMKGSNAHQRALYGTESKAKKKKKSKR